MVEGILATGKIVHVIASFFMPSRRSITDVKSKSNLKEHYLFSEPTAPRLYNDILFKKKVSTRLHQLVHKIVDTHKVELVYIYEGTSYFYFSKVTGYLQKNKIPLTFDVTEFRDNYYSVRNSEARKGIPLKQKFSNILLYPDYLLGKRAILSRATFFISISTCLREFLSHYKKDVLLIPGFEKFADPKAKEENDPRIKFLYVGSLIHRDAPEILEKLIAHLAGYNGAVQLNLIGRYDRLRKTKSMVEHWKEAYGELVQSLGEIEESLIEKEMQDCDVLVLPRKDSYEERCAFPTRLAEYLALKKPVVISPIGDIPHYLKDSVDACFLELDDTKRLTQKSLEQVARLISDADFRKFIGTNGYIAGSLQFDQHINAQAILERAAQNRISN